MTGRTLFRRSVLSGGVTFILATVVPGWTIGCSIAAGLVWATLIATT